MNRAALYARFSTDLQREQSLEDQFRSCERAAAAAGLEIVARFSDAGISGGTTQRPGYQALLAAARAGDFDTIVVEDTSRLWRSRASYGADSAELEDLEVHVLTCTGDDTRRDGYGLILGIKQAIAENVRKEISYRTRRGLEGLALAGKSTGGRCLGYGSPAEAEAVRRAFALRAEGKGYGAIAALLGWPKSSVRYRLGNARYTGQAIWGATERKGGARDSKKQRRVARPEPLVKRFDASLKLV